MIDSLLVMRLMGFGLAVLLTCTTAACSGIAVSGKAQPGPPDGGQPDASSPDAGGLDGAQEATPPPAPDCDAGVLGLVGPIDVGMTGSVAGSGGGPEGYEMFQLLASTLPGTGQAGVLLLTGPGNIDDGAVHSCHGALLSGSDNAWWCIGSGQLQVIGQAYTDARLADLSRLGACPGTPVAGQLVYCSYEWAPADGGVPSDCITGQALISGTLGSQSVYVTTRESSSISASQTPITEGSVMADGLAWLYYSNHGGVHGVLRFPDGSPMDGLVVCFGAGSTGAGGTIWDRFVLHNLSVVGKCPGTPVAGTETGCLL